MPMDVKVKWIERLTGRVQTKATPLVYERTPPTPIVQGVRQLEQRRKRVQQLMGLCVGLVCALAWFILSGDSQTAFVTTTTTQSLHIPPALWEIVRQHNTFDLIRYESSEQLGSDPLSHGIQWILRLAIVVWVSRLLSRVIRFVRKQSHSVGYTMLIALSLWMLSGHLIEQYRVQQQQQHMAGALLHYSGQVTDSPIAHIMRRGQVNPLMQHYIFAQAIMRQQPDAKPLIQSHLDVLVQAETQQQRNLTSFDPQTIYRLQQNVYGKALTPIAVQGQRLVQQQAHDQQRIKQGMLVLLVISSSILLLLIVLKQSLIRRIHRIKSIYDR